MKMKCKIDKSSRARVVAIDHHTGHAPTARAVVLGGYARVLGIGAQHTVWKKTVFKVV